MPGKTGNDWAIFTVEDFEDSFSFRIFGEDYLKYRHLLVPNTFLYGRVFVREGWIDRNTGKKKEPRLQYNNLQMLHDVMEKYSKKITLEIPLERLDEEKVVSLKSLVKTNKGEKQLHLLIYENNEKIHLNMLSRKYKIAISKKMLEQLEGEGFKYKLN
jgi:DNA polymerase-3 subunit alpha